MLRVRSCHSLVSRLALISRPNGGEVWIGNYQSNIITIIDAATDRVVQTVPAVGDGPASTKFTPDGKYVWVTNSRSNASSGFDVARRRVVARPSAAC